MRCWGFTGEQGAALVSHEAPNLMAGDRQGHLITTQRDNAMVGSTGVNGSVIG